MSRNPHEVLSEAELLRQLSGTGVSARRAFNLIYQRYAPLIGYARHQFSLTEAEAEEAYHEALLGLSKIVDRTDEVLSCKIKTVLNTMLSRRSIDALRRRPKSWVALDGELPLPYKANTDPLHQLIDQESLHQCHTQLAGLSESMREILMASAEGYSSSEIASRHGYKNAATVDVLKHRARRALRNRG